MLSIGKQLYNKILKLNPNHLFLLLLFLWFIINIIQAVTTGVIQDEAYYHFYSEKLAWGYYDHPPLVALMVKISSLLFSKELSIRFMTVLLQLFTLLIIWKTINVKKATSKDVLTFFGISASVVMFVVYGFITTPDSPLLFFTALFLFSYKSFLKEESILNCLLLAVSMGGLVYSKYQGGLVIIFVILSNPRLLINYKFWLSGIASLAIFVPHIVWQVQNNFVSFMYHLEGRSRPFNISHVLEYIPNQAFNFNPFILAITGYILYKFKSKDGFFKSLKYIIIGMILFFGIATTRGHSQPQWTIAASIPMIIIIFHYSRHSLKIDRYLKKFLYPSLSIILLLRVVIACDAIPLDLEFYRQEKWAQAIKEIAGDRVVVFRDGYQKPSQYRFYANEEATTVNSVYYRQNQYDLYGFNSNFYNRAVMIITDKKDSLAKPYKISKKDSIYVRFSDKLVFTSDIEISFNNYHKSLSINTNNTFYKVIFTNNGVIDINFNDPEHPVSLHLMIYNKRNSYSIPVTIINPPNKAANNTTINKGESITRDLNFTIPNTIPPGKYKIMLSLKCGPFREGYNSKPQRVELTK